MLKYLTIFFALLMLTNSISSASFLKKKPQPVDKEIGPSMSEVVNRVQIPPFTALEIPGSYMMPESIRVAMTNMLNIKAKGVTIVDGETSNFKDLSILTDPKTNQPNREKFGTIFWQTVTDSSGKVDPAKLKQVVGEFKKDMGTFVTEFDKAMTACGYTAQKDMTLSNKGVPLSVTTPQCAAAAKSTLSKLLNSQTIYTQTYANITSPIHVSYGHMRDEVKSNLRSLPSPEQIARKNRQNQTKQAIVNMYVEHENENIPARMAGLKQQAEDIEKTIVGTPELVALQKNVATKSLAMSKICQGKYDPKTCMNTISTLENSIKDFNNKMPHVGKLPPSNPPVQGPAIAGKVVQKVESLPAGSRKGIPPPSKPVGKKI
jgi:hypothetical protein